MVDIIIWLPKPFPDKCMITNIRTRMIKRITDTFTQRGVLLVALRLGFPWLPLLAEGSATFSGVARKGDFLIELISYLF